MYNDVNRTQTPPRMLTIRQVAQTGLLPEHIICNKMGWVRGNVSDFGDYGRQKSFYKEPPKIDFEPL